MGFQTFKYLSRGAVIDHIHRVRVLQIQIAADDLTIGIDLNQRRPVRLPSPAVFFAVTPPANAAVVRRKAAEPFSNSVCDPPVTAVRNTRCPLLLLMCRKR